LGKSIIHIGTPKATCCVSTASDGDAECTAFATAADESPDKDETQTHQNHKPEKSASTFRDMKKRLDYAFQIKEHMTKLNLPLNETGYSAIIKLLCKNKQFEKAEAMLDEAESVQQCKSKLRLYSSLLTAYGEATRMLDALRIWKQLRGHEGLVLTERELLALMRCATATGDSLVMEYVLTELAEEVPVPCKDTVAVILEWFGIAHSKHIESLTDKLADAKAVQQLLGDITNSDTSERPPSMGPVVSVDGWQISSACQIERETGKLTDGCLAGCHLQPVPLSDRAVKEMIKMNEAIVFDGHVAGSDCRFQGGRKGKKRYDFSPECRRREWDNFVRFLEQNEPKADSHRFNVVIDGANVGYHQKNFADAPPNVDYDQVNWMIRHFRIIKEQEVLLVMHSRHFSNKMLPQRYKALYESWIEEGILYQTPYGMNDDWFWMHAALKYNLLVVTNDEMRDHHFQMLAPRSFLRWKERQQVHFDFGSWEDGPEKETVNRHRQRKVILECPAAYSRRIQKVENGLVVPLAIRGDDNRFLDGSHYASDDEPDEETYLCICPKASPTFTEEMNETSHFC
jgi:mitochondrial ribonuclease P protein 3